MQIGSRELGVSTESTRLELSVRLWTPQCARERVCTRYKSQSLVLRTSHAAARSAAAAQWRLASTPARAGRPSQGGEGFSRPERSSGGNVSRRHHDKQQRALRAAPPTAHAHHTRHKPPGCQTACANRQQQPAQQHALHRVSCPSRQKHAPSQTTRRCTHCAEQLQRPS